MFKSDHKMFSMKNDDLISQIKNSEIAYQQDLKEHSRCKESVQQLAIRIQKMHDELAEISQRNKCLKEKIMQTEFKKDILKKNLGDVQSERDQLLRKREEKEKVSKTESQHFQHHRETIFQEMRKIHDNARHLHERYKDIDARQLIRNKGKNLDKEKETLLKEKKELEKFISDSVLVLEKFSKEKREFVDKIFDLSKLAVICSKCNKEISPKDYLECIPGLTEE